MGYSDYLVEILEKQWNVVLADINGSEISFDYLRGGMIEMPPLIFWDIHF